MSSSPPMRAVENVFSRVEYEKGQLRVVVCLLSVALPIEATLCGPMEPFLDQAIHCLQR